MSLCDGCKNRLIFKSVIEFVRCIHIGYVDFPITECSHFEERPKDNSKHFDEAKQTANKGKPPRKQPRLRSGAFEKIN